MKLKHGMRSEYERRHEEIWPELVQLLGYSGIRNYSIFLDEQTDTLFAYQEQVGESSSQALGSNIIVQKWWKYMADIMETNADYSPVSVPVTEVFHMD